MFCIAVLPLLSIMGLDAGPKNTCIYIVSVTVLIVSLLLFIAGLSGPYWTSGYVEGLDNGTYRLHQGLWLVCMGFGRDVECANAVANVANWFRAIQGLQLTALILWVGTAGYGAVSNCLDPRPSHAVVLLVGTMLSCLISFIGLMIYVGKVPDDMVLFGTSVLDLDFDWAFALDLVGTLVGFVAAFGVALSYRATPFAHRANRETRYPTTSEAVYSSANEGYIASEVVYPKSGETAYPPSESVFPSSEGVYTPGEGVYP